MNNSDRKCFTGLIVFLLVFLASSLLSGCGRREPRRDVYNFDPPPNFVLISLDTLRADHLGCYGYARNTSPNIDRLAARSMVFLNAYTAAPATAESHMSIFTSLYPSVHKVATTVGDKEIHVLDESITTFPRILKSHGYTNVAFHGGGHVEGKYGFGRGFDFYEARHQHKAEEWLRDHAADNKFFLFYHTYHVHGPYMPNAPYDTMFDPDYKGKIISKREAVTARGWQNINREYWDRVDKSDPADVAHLVALYDGLIAELDNELAALFTAIDQYAPTTVIIVISDHGEEFGEHGNFEHGRLNWEVLRVPLIIRLPGQEHCVRLENEVTLMDLAPTILDIASIEPFDQFEGEVLPDAPESAGERLIFAEFPLTRSTCVIAGDRQLARQGGYEKPSGDAGKDSDIRKLRAALAEFEARNKDLAIVHNRDERKERLDPKTIKRLKALGYIK